MTASSRPSPTARSAASASRRPFVSIDRSDIVDAQLKGKSIQVTVKFLSKLITATYDKAGAVVDGAPDKIVDVTDIWTFAHDAGSRDPNWKLIATESGH